jgi:fucose permease
VRADIGEVRSTGAIGPVTVVRAAITSRQWTVVALAAASLEVTASQWGPTLLEERAGLGDTTINVTSSAFWAAITVVRLLGPTIERARPVVPLAILGMVIASVAALGLLVDPVAPVALVVIGAGSALLFPTLVGATATRAADPSVAVAGVFLAGSTGGTGAPAVASGVVAIAGVGAIAVVLSAFAASAAWTARRALSEP